MPRTFGNGLRRTAPIWNSGGNCEPDGWRRRLTLHLSFGHEKRVLLRSVMLMCLLLSVSCVGKRTGGHDAWRKVEVDLTRLDANGLRGPSNGKAAVSYEFCIPNTDRCKARVKAIDKTVKFMPGSRGRIGAGERECLCIGSTHQENHRSVLRALAELPFVERIMECHFE